MIQRTKVMLQEGGQIQLERSHDRADVEGITLNIRRN